MALKHDPLCCPVKPELTNRPLLTGSQAQDLEETFKVLGNATRLRMVHALVLAGELTVGRIAEALAMKPQAVSNQLQRLSDRGIVAARRDGHYIHYRIVDPCVITLLDQGLCLTEDAQPRIAYEDRVERNAS